jgi:hypothetical protein
VFDVDDPGDVHRQAIEDDINIIDADESLRASDDLYVTIGGAKVLPIPNRIYYVSFPPGSPRALPYRPDRDTFDADVFPAYDSNFLPQDADATSFIGSTEVQFWEQDTGSRDDNLGAVTFALEETSDGSLPKPVASTLAIASPRAEDGAIYQFSYNITPGTGSFDDIPTPLRVVGLPMTQTKTTPLLGRLGRICVRKVTLRPIRLRDQMSVILFARSHLITGYFR